MDIPRKTWDEQFNNQLQICKVVCTAEYLQVVNLRGMYMEDESHSYHISSLMDRKMKGEKLDGNLEKGFGMLRKDNQPQRARSSSLSSKG